MTPEIRLTCAECAEHLADFFDGAEGDGRLGAELNAAVEAHLAGCAECAELARDAGAAVALMERAAVVELPPALVPRILAEITTGPSRVLVQPSLAERIFGRWIRPVLQPRVALSLAMAALSIAMIPRFWKSTAPDPGRILMVAENRVYRTFDRAVKGYESLALVNDVQSQIDEWNSSQSGESPDGKNAEGLRNSNTPPEAGAGADQR
ncbi:MAG TPA: zf-HC2 domain-containing protein [Bryobacteraceae bacterium]|nr:zf-HC2 domain-containing protein [Bryobacteraceae bacterium]